MRHIVAAAAIAFRMVRTGDRPDHTEPGIPRTQPEQMHGRHIVDAVRHPDEEVGEAHLQCPLDAIAERGVERGARLRKLRQPLRPVAGEAKGHCPRHVLHGRMPPDR